MSDLQQAAERMRRVFDGEHATKVYKPRWDECVEVDRVQLNDLITLAHAYLDTVTQLGALAADNAELLRENGTMRAEILVACLEESMYDGLYARLMELHKRGE